MARYTINLPGNIPADVRQGKVINKSIGLVKHWPWLRFRGEEKTGYVVTVEAGNKQGMQYHLLKANDGSWPAGATNELDIAVKIQGKWQTIEEDQVTTAIKQAIDAYENK
jgi:hypothetical protein